MPDNPQVARTKAVVLDAALRLLEAEGPDAVTHLRVAETAGVSRATVYRHWPERLDLLVDALASGATPAFAAPPGADARERLVAALRRAAENLDGDLGRSLALLLARAGWDDRFAEAKAVILDAGRAVLESILLEGRAAGDLDFDEDPGLLVERLLGAVFARRRLFDLPVDDAWLEGLVSAVVRPRTT